MLVSIFSRGKRMSAACFSRCHFCHTGKSPLLRGAASPDVLDSIWKAKFCFPRTPFSIGLQSLSQLPRHPCLCLRQGNARVPGWGGVSLMVVAAGECHPNRKVLCVVLQQVLTLLCTSGVGKPSLSTGKARTQHKNVQCCVNAGPLFIAPQSVQTSVTGFYMTLGYILTWINGKCFSSKHLGLYFI